MAFCPVCSEELASETLLECGRCHASFAEDSGYKPLSVKPATPQSSDRFAWLVKAGTVLRLMNLALSMSAIFALPYMFLASQSSSRALSYWRDPTPASWILSPWFSKSSLATVAPEIVLIAWTGMNLLLPASILLILFWLAGFHRKHPNPAPLTPMGLAIVWMMYLFLFWYPVIGGVFNTTLQFIIGLAFIPAVILVVGIAGGTLPAELGNWFQAKKILPPHIPRALLACALIPPILSLVPLLLAPSNPLANTAREHAEFKRLCQDAGVRLAERPTGPVRSLAYISYSSYSAEWDRGQTTGDSLNVSRIELDADGRIERVGGWVKPGSTEERKKVVLEFSESRGPWVYTGSTRPTAPHVRLPDVKVGHPGYGVNAFTADALAQMYILASDVPDRKKPSNAGEAVRYRITLSDRRSGAMLGEQIFVVDQSNSRACGANVDNVISVEAFFYDAFNR